MAAAAGLEARVRALGPRFDAGVNDATRAIYRSHVNLDKAGDEYVDMPYGPHERHRLDVYCPRHESRGTVVYVHGGGFIGGSKNGDGVFYVNIGRWLARSGWTAVVPNYRLAPKDGWPAGALDVDSTVRWLRRSPDFLAPNAPLVIWGQSAGASHVASWVFDPAVAGDTTQVAGVMLMSGFYLPEAPLGTGPAAYFGADSALYSSRAPLTHVTAPLLAPLWLSLAELDPAASAQQTYAMARAISLAQGSSPDVHCFRGHNHVSTVQSIGTEQSDVADEITRFLQRF